MKLILYILNTGPRKCFSLRTRDKKAHILQVDQRGWTNCNYCMHIVSRNKFFDIKYLWCHMISKETIWRHFHNENTTLWALVYFEHKGVELIMIPILSVVRSLFQFLDFILVISWLILDAMIWCHKEPLFVLFGYLTIGKEAIKSEISYINVDNGTMRKWGGFGEFGSPIPLKI